MPSLSDLFSKDESTESNNDDAAITAGNIACAGIVRLNFTAPSSVNVFDPKSNKDRLSAEL